PRREHPAPRARVAPQEPQAHQRVRAALCRAHRHAGTLGELRQAALAPLAAEGFQHGERLLHRAVEQGIARARRARPARRALHLFCSIGLSIIDSLCRGGGRYGTSAVSPPMCDCSAAGTPTEPSWFWKFSSTATSVRPTASPEPFRVCTASGLPP